MSYESEYVPLMTVSALGYRHIFHTYRRCPTCQCDMLTDGRGLFMCDVCGYRDKRDVAELKQRYGYAGDGRQHWNRFVYGRSEK